MSGTQQRIAVLVDGMNRHRDHHLRAAQAIVDTLAEAGHEASPLFVDRDLDLALRQGRFDVAFLATRGRQTADGSVQGLLEMMGIAYTGSGVFATALCAHPAKSKDVLRLHNLPTAPGYVIRSDSDRPVLDQHGSFGFPVLVSAAGAALGPGVSLASDELELEAAVEEAFRSGEEVLVERLMDGRAVTVAVLDGTPLGAVDLGSLVGLLAPPAAAGTAGGRRPGGERAEGKLRARFASARHRSLLRIAQQSCEALGVEGPALVELTVSDRLNEVVRSVDAAPVLTPGSVFARIAGGAGLGFDDLVEEILRGARLKAQVRRRERRSLQVAFRGPDRRSGLAALPH